MKLLVDMNLSPTWVDRLNKAGFHAVHWSGAGRMDAADSEIMAYAAKHDYVVLTHDLDFSAILAATQGTKPSVVQIRAENLSPAAIGDPLIVALQQMTPDPCGRCAAYGRSESHPTQSAATAFQQTLIHRDQYVP